MGTGRAGSRVSLAHRRLAPVRDGTDQRCRAQHSAELGTSVPAERAGWLERQSALKHHVSEPEPLVDREITQIGHELDVLIFQC